MRLQRLFLYEEEKVTNPGALLRVFYLLFGLWWTTISAYMAMFEQMDAVSLYLALYVLILTTYWMPPVQGRLIGISPWWRRMMFFLVSTLTLTAPLTIPVYVYIYRIRPVSREEMLDRLRTSFSDVRSMMNGRNLFRVVAAGVVLGGALMVWSGGQGNLPERPPEFNISNAFTYAAAYESARASRDSILEEKDVHCRPVGFAANRSEYYVLLGCGGTSRVNLFLRRSCGSWIQYHLSDQ
jgi:hypothetical protein